MFSHVWHTPKTVRTSQTLYTSALPLSFGPRGNGPFGVGHVGVSHGARRHEYCHLISGLQRRSRRSRRDKAVVADCMRSPRNTRITEVFWKKEKRPSALRSSRLNGLNTKPKTIVPSNCLGQLCLSWKGGFVWSQSGPDCSEQLLGTIGTRLDIQILLYNLIPNWGRVLGIHSTR